MSATESRVTIPAAWEKESILEDEDDWEAILSKPKPKEKETLRPMRTTSDTFSVSDPEVVIRRLEEDKIAYMEEILTLREEVRTLRDQVKTGEAGRWECASCMVKCDDAAIDLAYVEEERDQAIAAKNEALVWRDRADAHALEMQRQRDAAVVGKMWIDCDELMNTIASSGR